MKHHPETEVEPPKRYSTSPSTADTSRVQRGRPPSSKLKPGLDSQPTASMYAMTSYAQLAQAQEQQLKQYQSLWGSYYQK